MLCRYLLQFWKRALLVLAFALGVTMFAIGDTPKAAGIEGVRITHAQLAPGVVELWQGDAATNVELPADATGSAAHICQRCEPRVGTVHSTRGQSTTSAV